MLYVYATLATLYFTTGIAMGGYFTGNRYYREDRFLGTLAYMFVWPLFLFYKLGQNTPTLPSPLEMLKERADRKEKQAERAHRRCVELMELKHKHEMKELKAAQRVIDSE